MVCDQNKSHEYIRVADIKPMPHKVRHMRWNISQSVNQDFSEVTCEWLSDLRDSNIESQTSLPSTVANFPFFEEPITVSVSAAETVPGI